MNLNHSFEISRSLDRHDRLDQAKLPKRAVEASLGKVLLVAGEIDVGNQARDRHSCAPVLDLAEAQRVSQPLNRPRNAMMFVGCTSRK